MIIVNGEKKDIENIGLKEYLEKENISADSVAVMLNDDILEKPQIENAVLKDGDILEIVGFVGGG